MSLKRALAERLLSPALAYVRRGPGRQAKVVLLRRLLEPALRGAPRDFTTTTLDGFAFAGSTGDMIQRYVYLFGVWEPHLTAWLRGRLRPGDTFVDVGANVGYFSLLGASLVGPGGNVVAVEALPATFEQLEANLARNASRNVRALNVAATAEPCEVVLYGGEAHNSGTTSMIPGAGLRTLATVAGSPLESLLTPEEIATAKVVKIDVEGAELDVLRGLEPVLGALPDDVALVIEVDPEADAKGVWELLAGHGFNAYRMINDYTLAGYVDPGEMSAPVRVREPGDQREDLVFSRVDAESLV